MVSLELSLHCALRRPLTSLLFRRAKQYSGVSTLSFLKHITAQELTRDGLGALGPVVETLAAAEGLDAHKMAVTVRLRALRAQQQAK